MTQPRRIERQCAECGRTFVSAYRRCSRCRTAERICTRCGATYRSKQGGLCPSCAPRERECPGCGRTFKGTARKCQRCRATGRICATCGDSFTGNGTKCWRCYAGEKPCATCGRPIRTGSQLCSGCRATYRECATCGRAFKGRSLECKPCSGQGRASENARRARKRAAEVAGPLPRSVYVAIMRSGPCVYCDAPADTVDHVRPLGRHGHEAVYNLVPACGPCNYSKGDRLLTEWDSARVAHAAARSPLVAAELKRLNR